MQSQLISTCLARWSKSLAVLQPVIGVFFLPSIFFNQESLLVDYLSLEQRCMDCIWIGMIYSALQHNQATKVIETGLRWTLDEIVILLVFAWHDISKHPPPPNFVCDASEFSQKCEMHMKFFCSSVFGTRADVSIKTNHLKPPLMWMWNILLWATWGGQQK